MHLPRCEQVLEPETIACPCCQGQLHKIGEDISEVLDIIPAILRVAADDLSQVRLQQLHRWRDPGCYLPLYRQVQILAGQGIHLDRGTLAGWEKRTAWWLKSL